MLQKQKTNLRPPRRIFMGWQKNKKWLIGKLKLRWRDKNFRIVINLILIAAALAVIFLFIQKFNFQPEVSNGQPEEEIIEAGNCEAERRLDGVCVKEGEENLFPVAIMIDNFIKARPPANLSKAQLVYEALTEGGIPRFMAVYATAKEIGKIGPVRSARPYFIAWAEELRAVYMHGGGSPQALAKLNDRSSNVYDVNEFYQGQYFWRDNGLDRPYNVFTSTELIQAYRSGWDLPKTGNYDPWQFVDDIDLASRGEDGQIISFNYSPYDYYYTEWRYYREKNSYYRRQNGEPHKDKSGLYIKAKNIIFQYIPTIVIDQIGRKKINTVGSGKILIFQNGLVNEGTWEKGSLKQRTKFYYADGSEVKFVRGTTWIIAMPIGYEINY